MLRAAGGEGAGRGARLAAAQSVRWNGRSVPHSRLGLIGDGEWKLPLLIGREEGSAWRASVWGSEWGGASGESLTRANMCGPREALSEGAPYVGERIYYYLRGSFRF